MASNQDPINQVYLTLTPTEATELQKLLGRSLSRKSNSTLGGVFERLQAYGTGMASKALTSGRHARERSRSGKGKPYERQNPPGGAGAGQQGGAHINWDCARGTVNFLAQRWQQVNVAVGIHSDSGPFFGRLASFIRSECSRNSFPSAVHSVLYNSSGASALAYPKEESLSGLVRRVQLSEVKSARASFAVLIDQLRLAALIETLGNIGDVYDKEVSQWPDAPSSRTFYDWVAEGYRVAALAAGGSIYLILLVSLGGMKSMISAMAGDVAHAIGNTLRAPEAGSAIGDIIRTTLVPIVQALRFIAPFDLSALLPTPFLLKKGLPGGVDAGDIRASDCFMDSFQLTHFKLVERDQEVWRQILLVPHRWNCFNTNISSNYANYANYANIANFFAVSYTISFSFINTPFITFALAINSARATAGAGRYSFNYDYWTDRQRELAKEALLNPPSTFEGFCEELSTLYEGGTKIDKDKYLYVPRNQLPMGANAVRLESLSGDLEALLCTAMPESLRQALNNGIAAALGSSGVLKERDWEEDGLFEALHFAWYNRYSTKGNTSANNVHPCLSKREGIERTNHFQFTPRTSTEARKFPNIYENLVSALCDVFAWVEGTIRKLVGRDIEIQMEVSNSLPLNSRVPLFPFTGLVFNFNAASKAHRDKNDLGFCLVLPFGDYKGGHLCLQEQGWVIDLQPGDFLIFRSSGTTHFNLRYKGIRGSIVGHTDKEFLSWLGDFNGWKDNIYLSAKRREGFDEGQIVGEGEDILRHF
ncbi:hypothetical protein GLOTRDRAFT_134150 [Gloeophyllum trabeum ATCC 11539]|uniref:Uncharacterized protein n=1 Tax=Gloeophyllum trabeum (strain ATCC 11539 / FP-39264 / Madison 617) TaxID=670483 RepID=S7PS44_GLOTA|nr:uncharacterized protein GLOTRDRAFT_134150 [Gloeophyllum trabeum ATCC 11539]EPQ50213.1 hypothetical protein GLOTRDRAFT_134150 [Gloeophyllum trabeum ATCC 11539]